MFGYKCTTELLSNARDITTTKHDRVERESAMGCVRAKYRTAGTSALAVEQQPRLRIVAREEQPSCIADPSPRIVRRAPNMRIISLACMLCVLACTLVFALDQYHAITVASRIEASPKETVYVARGDTMWNIAERHAVEGVSTYELVSWMRTSNGLHESSLVPGMELTVPSQHS